MFLNLSHLQAAILFALFASVVLGIVGREDDRSRLRYALYCFGCFIAAIFGLSWLMYFGHG
jgi:UDP-N-acetylmuramyl pentapeptide phosphotransferase/UDP-N-acetylglucosamine-1-phosphate transferase